ncbi:hypothetical protein [Aureimonas ureilytica]|uniref:hypothetical protein n=1 Tax=Aureimonas ureilytica TaxID=401562 RepID=UPI00037C634F|nr:hypothetical protein [Aureimonas ureilytica]
MTENRSNGGPAAEVEQDESPFNGLASRLYHTPYLVMPRLALEAMPIDWQRRFEALLKEADDAGLETPGYYVLRDEPEYTTTEDADSTDPTSRIETYHSLRNDPWANYRRGDAWALSLATRSSSKEA